MRLISHTARFLARSRPRRAPTAPVVSPYPTRVTCPDCGKMCAVTRVTHGIWPHYPRMQIRPGCDPYCDGSMRHVRVDGTVDDDGMGARRRRNGQP